MNLPPFILLIAWLLVSALAVYLVGRIDAAAGGRRGSARWLALICLLGGGIGLARLTADSLGDSPATLWTLGGVTMRYDGLSLLISWLVVILTTAVTFYSGPTTDNDEGSEKCYVLLLLLCAAIIGLSSAGDLFNLWLWFEAMAVCAYPLVTQHRDDRRSLEAGVKYLVQSAAGSSLILVGIAFVFMNAGTLDISRIAAALAQSAAPAGSVPIWLVAGLLFIVGFGIKAALVPLHTWLPDAHSQAPSGISAMLSAIVIEAGLVALLRALSGLAGAMTLWGTILMVAGAVNMLLGNLMALRQSQVKRMLAYSSISHVGYIITALGVALYLGTGSGAQAGLFHVFTHGLMKSLAFMAAGAFLFALHQDVARSASDTHPTLMVSDLNGAASRYPLPALIFSLALLALAGMPPLAGFMSKWQILMAGAQAHQGLILALMVFLGLNSVLSLGYYAPLVNRIYRIEPAAAVSAGGALPMSILGPVIMLAVAVVILGLWPSLMQDITTAAATDLLSSFGR